MTPRHHIPGHGETGFVLIGVVIFVLALTIIGISLFSLSSYEAQFFQRSLDGEQAFQSAVGGIERAKFALAVTSRLPSVSENLPRENVLSAVAIQNGDSTGAVNWHGADVTVRVTAEVNGARRTIEGRFSPIVTLSYYSSLITVGHGIEVETVSPYAPKDRNHAVLLEGPVWEGSGQNPNVWTSVLRPPAPDSIRTSPAVPVPDVAPFLDPSGPIATASLAGESEPDVESVVYTLIASGPPGVPCYFKAEETDPNFSVNTWTVGSHYRKSCTIQVSGLAVWLLPKGALFAQGTVITGDPATDCLVVIAGPMTGTFGASPAPHPTSSICSLGSLQAHIPVILVSSGEVLLWHENNYDAVFDDRSFTTDLAIFARSARFMGPSPNALFPGMLLSRVPNGPLDDHLLDALASQGALPNASSASGRRLDLVPGSWQASDR